MAHSTKITLGAEALSSEQIAARACTIQKVAYEMKRYLDLVKSTEAAEEGSEWKGKAPIRSEASDSNEDEWDRD
ncbi:MAG: hypothetical protein Q9166_004033 [cf. Caloplaca sp. 2 TL-2023]